MKGIETGYRDPEEKEKHGADDMANRRRGPPKPREITHVNKVTAGSERHSSESYEGSVSSKKDQRGKERKNAIKHIEAADQCA